MIPRIILFMLWFAFTHTLFAQEGSQDENVRSSPVAKFIPDISLNTDFSGLYRNLVQDQFSSLEIPGFGPSGFYGDTLNPQLGFNFNYAELTLTSVVDPFFDFFAGFHLTMDTFEIEEAYARTLGLPANFQLKVGKFLSSFGRLNEVHAHAWDFSDQTLVYHAFFGAEDLNELGVKLSWIVPLPIYLTIGVEALSGMNAISFGSVGFSDSVGVNIIASGTFPEVYTGYIKSSFDMDELVILLGLSAARGTMRTDYGIADTGGFGISGASSLLGADLTLKWLLDSSRYLAWQSEFIYRNIDGNQYSNDGTSAGYTANQSGLYSQLVFQFYRGWRVGARYDLLQKNSVAIGGIVLPLPQNLARYSAMFEYSPSEFTRFRFQYNYDLSGYNGNEVGVNHQFALNANFNIGTHGAHSF